MVPAGAAAAQPTGTLGGAPGSHDGEGYMAQLNLLQSRMDDFKNEMCSTLSEHKRFMVTMNQNIRRIATQPVVRPLVNTTTGPSQSSVARNTTPKKVKLSRSPPSLVVLWNEYEKGLGGQKAAKFYTEKERGANKHTYSRRKVFWDAVEM